MTTDPTAAGAPGLIDRAKNILLQPRAEWDRIAGEPAEVGKLYTGYVLPLLILSAVAGFIGSTLIGHSGFGVTIRVPMTTALISFLQRGCCRHQACSFVPPAYS